MKIVSRRVWVVPCPKCKRPIDFSGEGGIYFRSKKKALYEADCWLGASGMKTLTGLCQYSRHGGRKP